MQGTSITVPVRNMGETVRASLAGAVNTFLSALPRLLGCIAVLIVGWVLSSLLARGVAALLHAIKFNELARRSGFADFVRNMGVRQDASWFIAGIAKWFVRLITLVVAFDLLGLPAVSGGLPAASALAAEPPGRARHAGDRRPCRQGARPARARHHRRSRVQQSGRARGGHQGGGLGVHHRGGRQSGRHRDGR